MMTHKRRKMMAVVGVVVLLFLIATVTFLLIVLPNLYGKNPSDTPLNAESGQLVGPCSSERACYSTLKTDLPLLQRFADRIIGSGASRFDTTTDLGALGKREDGQYVINSDTVQFALPELEELQASGWLTSINEQDNEWSYVGIGGSSAEKYANFTDLLVDRSGSLSDSEHCAHDDMIHVSYAPGRNLTQETKDNKAPYIRVADSDWFFAITTWTEAKGSQCPMS